MQERSVWGWGYDAGVSSVPKPLIAAVEATLSKGLPPAKASIPMPTKEVLARIAANLRPPRFAKSDMPANVAELCSDDGIERMRHAYGKSFEDLCRAASLDYSNPRGFSLKSIACFDSQTDAF